MQHSHIRRVALGTVAAIVFNAAPSFSQQAAGNPIFDCAGMRTTSARLKAGLPLQDQWIKSTEAQLRDAEAGVRQSKETLQATAVKSAIDLATGQLKAVADFRTALENANGFSLVKRGQWLQKVARLEELAQNIDKATKVGGAAVAGRNLGTLMQTNRATLQDFISQISESGISDELGLKAAVFAGPAGVLVVQTFMVARDVGFAAAEGVMSATEAAAARDNLAQMRAAGDTVRSRAYELDSIVGGSDCTPRTAAPQDRIQVEPPSEPTPAEAPTTPPNSPKTGGGSGKVIMSVLGLGAVGVGTLVALKAVDSSLDLSGLTTTPTTTTSTTTTSSSTATYRAQVTDNCTPGANGDIFAGQIGTPCSQVVGGACGASPASFTFTVRNGVISNECWIGNATNVSSTYTGRFLWSTCDDPTISGPLPGQWTLTCTEGRTRPATHRYTVTVTRQ